MMALGAPDGMIGRHVDGSPLRAPQAGVVCKRATAYELVTSQTHGITS
jgi:hypothetical protein